MSKLHVLFLHPNFPGQFLRLARGLARLPQCHVTTLGDASWTKENPILDNTRQLTYPQPEAGAESTHGYVRNMEAAVRRGQQVVKTLLPLKYEGYEPDVIYAHPGWGDALFIKDIFPSAKVISLLEYFYHPRGADVGFDPEFPLVFDDIFRLRILNSVQLHALQSSDVLISPTTWQRTRYPSAYHDRIEVMHEGIDTRLVAPDPHATLLLDNGLTLQAGDEVLTYVSRGLEPYRGFHSFMRALPAILRERPDCRVLIVGDDKAVYGPSPKQAENWREVLLEELAGQVDLNRVFFLGTLPYEQYLLVLQISRVHVYLTYPFILSWSMLEAMSAGCLVIGSDTAPVQEILSHQYNGLLCPFFEPDTIATQVIDALARPAVYQPLRERARALVIKSFDFESVILPKHLSLLARLS
jgi:glycosyltransferase involved in cell wall biosynthesis